MIKTFEQFNNDILCEAYKLKRPKVIDDLIVYSEKGNGICKTWDEVLKLFNNPKYNVPCAQEHDEDDTRYSRFRGSNWIKYDDTLLEILKDINDIKYIYINNGVIHIKCGKKYDLIKLHILTDSGRRAHRSTDLSKSQYHTKIRIDLLDEYNDTTNSNSDDNKEENVIEDLTLYDNFPTSDDKPNRTWEEAIQILSNPKYNVKCAVVSLDKQGYGKYKYIHDGKEYRYRNDDVRRESGILDELERINSNFSVKYKKISIRDGAIVFTVQVNSAKYIFLICPLNEQGRKIMGWENKDLLDPKYRIKIEEDIFDDSDTTINKHLQKIKTSTSKENIDKILDDAFKSTTREQYSIISACTLCREIELGIWESTDIKGEDIIKAIEERFGITYSTEK